MDYVLYIWIPAVEFFNSLIKCDLQAFHEILRESDHNSRTEQMLFLEL
jgi:hypothetical protein